MNEQEYVSVSHWGMFKVPISIHKAPVTKPPLTVEQQCWLRNYEAAARSRFIPGCPFPTVDGEA